MKPKLLLLLVSISKQLVFPPYFKNSISGVGTEPLTPCILVIGNEGKGIRRDNMQYIERKILITGSQDKIAESLN